MCDAINNRTYQPTAYSFIVTDPKPREIFASDFSTRILHHYIHERLVPMIDKRLSKHTFNNRKGMGTSACQDAVISDMYEVSNGYTEDSMLVFNENKDYLKSVSSLDEIENRNFEKNVTFSKPEFCKKLDINCENIIINNVIRSKSNRVNEITINNKTFKGTEFRKILNLRSTDFTINISNEVIITTYGYGHGVGMSQYGANYLAKKGYNYEQILKYYYQGVNITCII